jgi:hypothetical protein
MFTPICYVYEYFQIFMKSGLDVHEQFDQAAVCSDEKIPCLAETSKKIDGPFRPNNTLLPDCTSFLNLSANTCRNCHYRVSSPSRMHT